MLGSLKGFLAPAPEEIMGVWIWGVSFSAPGIASPVHANLSPGGYFSRIIPIFFLGGGGGGGGAGGLRGGASFRQGLLTRACGFQRRFVRIRLVSHNSDEVPESKFGRRKCRVVGTFEVI